MKRLALILLMVAGCNRASADATGTEEKPQTPEHTATRVEVATMRKSPATLSLSLPGEVEGVKDALLAAPLGGYVESVHVKAGEQVKRGKLLARVDTATHSARRNQAQVELQTAEQEYERAKKLGDAIPKAELDAAESRLRAARAALRTQGTMHTRSAITAPFSGTVVDVNVEAGEVAVPGAPLLRLVELDPVKVSVSLSDRDVVAIREGMEATVRTEARGTPMKGTVTHIHRAADLRTRSFLADIEVANPDKALLPGMIASVRLDVKIAESELVISQDWLVTRIDELGVFIDQGGVAAYRTVKLGPVVGDRVVVTSGLKPGDDLVITGHRELAEGDKLVVSRKGVCCKNGRVTFK